MSDVTGQCTNNLNIIFSIQNLFELDLTGSDTLCVCGGGCYHELPGDVM